MRTILKNCLFVFMSLCLFTLTACGKAKKSEPAAKAEAVQTLPKLLDLGAHQCIPCKMMAPILDELTKEYKGVFDVEFIDVWQPENRAKAQAHGIQSIPTQIFFDAEGKELWRHVGFISKEDILKKWKELGYEMKAKTEGKVEAGANVERWHPAVVDQRDKASICQLSDTTINPKTLVTIATPKGDVRIQDVHHFFIYYTSLTNDKADLETRVSVADWQTGVSVKVGDATFLTGRDKNTGRPWIRAFADYEDAMKSRSADGGSIVSWDALKKIEMSHRCGFCDRACYPQDAAEVLIEGVQSYGCCAHCAMGVAARTGKNIEVRQPDALTGDMIVAKTRDGRIGSIEPRTAVAWYGQKKTKDGKWVSAGCFHQGFFTSVDNLRKWLEKHPLETGKMISIEQSLTDKMKLKPEQIQNACKIGECAPM